MGNLQELLAAKGHSVSVHHIKEMRSKQAPQADLYVLSSPTRIGKPIRSMRGFAKKLALPAGSKYALIATYGAASPNKKTGVMPTEEELAKYRKNLSIMDGILGGKGATKVAELKVFVQDLKGPLEDGWEGKVAGFVEDIQAKLG